VPRWLWRGSESHHMQDFDDTLALPWFVFDSTMAGIATPSGAYPFPCWGLACKLRLSGLRKGREGKVFQTTTLAPALIR